MIAFARQLSGSIVFCLFLDHSNTDPNDAADGWHWLDALTRLQEQEIVRAEIQSEQGTLLRRAIRVWRRRIFLRRHSVLGRIFLRWRNEAITTHLLRSGLVSAVGTIEIRVPRRAPPNLEENSDDDFSE